MISVLKDPRRNFFETDKLLKLIKYLKHCYEETFRTFSGLIERMLEEMLTELEKFSIFDGGIDRKAAEFAIEVRPTKVVFKELDGKLLKKLVRNTRIKTLIEGVKIETNKDFGVFNSKRLIRDVMEMQ